MSLILLGESTTIVRNIIGLLRLRGEILLQHEALVEVVLLLLLIRHVVVHRARHHHRYHRIAGTCRTGSVTKVIRHHAAVRRGE